VSDAAKARILIIRGGAIGDFILTLPALAAVRERFPAVHLEVLGYAHIAQLAKAGGIVDAVRSIEAAALAPFFARRGELPPEMQSYFAGFALIISYLYDPDEIFRDNVGRCSKAQFVQGPHRPDDAGTTHATDVFLQPLERLAIFEMDAVPRLNVSPELPQESPGRIGEQSGLVEWLALHPGSGSERKNWPEARWAELLRRLELGPQQRVLLVGGEAEGKRLQRLSPAVRGPVDLAFHLPLARLASQLAACRYFVGHDSGITHLAAAVGLPGLVLWGETAEQVWRPRSHRMTLLRAGAGLPDLPVDLVQEALGSPWTE
jgi:heptosyltransferase-3